MVVRKREKAIARLLLGEAMSDQEGSVHDAGLSASDRDSTIGSQDEVDTLDALSVYSSDELVSKLNRISTVTHGFTFGGTSRRRRSPTTDETDWGPSIAFGSGGFRLQLRVHPKGAFEALVHWASHLESSSHSEANSKSHFQSGSGCVKDTQFVRRWRSCPRCKELARHFGRDDCEGSLLPLPSVCLMTMRVSNDGSETESSPLNDSVTTTLLFSQAHYRKVSTDADGLLLSASPPLTPWCAMVVPSDHNPLSSDWHHLFSHSTSTNRKSLLTTKSDVSLHDAPGCRGTSLSPVRIRAVATSKRPGKDDETKREASDMRVEIREALYDVAGLLVDGQCLRSRREQYNDALMMQQSQGKGITFPVQSRISLFKAQYCGSLMDVLAERAAPGGRRSEVGFDAAEVALRAASDVCCALSMRSMHSIVGSPLLKHCLPDSLASLLGYPLVLLAGLRLVCRPDLFWPKVMSPEVPPPSYEGQGFDETGGALAAYQLNSTVEGRWSPFEHSLGSHKTCLPLALDAVILEAIAEASRHTIKSKDNLLAILPLSCSPVSKQVAFRLHDWSASAKPYLFALFGAPQQMGEVDGEELTHPLRAAKRAAFAVAGQMKPSTGHIVENMSDSWPASLLSEAQARDDVVDRFTALETLLRSNPSIVRTHDEALADSTSHVWTGGEWETPFDACNMPSPLCTARERAVHLLANGLAFGAMTGCDTMSLRFVFHSPRIKTFCSTCGKRYSPLQTSLPIPQASCHLCRKRMCFDCAVARPANIVRSFFCGSCAAVADSSSARPSGAGDERTRQTESESGRDMEIDKEQESSILQ